METLRRPSTIDNKIADLVTELLHASTRLHLTHLSVTGVGSFAAHKALNEIYESIADKADDIAEQYQGIIEKVLPYPTNFSNISLKTKEEALSYLRDLYQRVNEIQKIVPYSEIINQLDELKSMIDSAKYKLILLQ